MKNKRNSSSSNAFFLCFTMRNPNSQPLASPNRHSTSSLYASLSRRLSLHSSSSHRKSSSSETAEPSSPKVTCIGQVKIKSKRKSGSGNNQHLVNRSRSGRDTSSFRRREVKAVSICDALSCFMPSSCFGWNSCYYDSNGSGKKDQRKCDGNKRRKRYSCGTVFIRWLMATNGGGGEEEEEEGKKMANLNDFRGMDFFAREIEEDDELENAFGRKKEEENEEDDVEVNVCIPPKNALLLMRCRSDPVRMAALSTRFWDSPAMKVDCRQENDGESEIEKVEKQIVLDEGLKIEEDKKAVAKDESVEVLEKIVESKDIDTVENVLKKVDEREDGVVVLRRSTSCSISSSIELSKLKGGEKRRSFSYREKEKRRDSFSVEKESNRHSFCSEKEARRSSFSGNNKESNKRWSFSFEKESLGLKDKTSGLHSLEEAKTEDTASLEEKSIKVIEQPKLKSSQKEDTQIVEIEKKPQEIPDCLLLMMYEPKLSMEVSKETWVCNTDFVHQRRNQQSKPKHERKAAEEAIIEEDTDHAENEKAITSVHQTQTEQPSIISPMERKLLKSLAVSALTQPQHLVLTRCKSEPGKSSARLVADTCFWKARHQPIGPVGLGF